MSCDRLATVARNAANESAFMPAVCSDPEFASWTRRVAFRLLNLPSGWSEQQMRVAMFKELTPSPEWAEGLAFMMELARENQRKALAP